MERDDAGVLSDRDMTQPERLTFRPHHFLCALGFAGEGYSDAFTKNMYHIVQGRLRTPLGGETEITVIETADSICAPCPERRGSGCSKLEKITGLDQRHADALGLVAGQTITWQEAQTRIRNAVQPGDLAQLCQDCQWRPLGACEAALRRLHET